VRPSRIKADELLSDWNADRRESSIDDIIQRMVCSRSAGDGLVQIMDTARFNKRATTTGMMEGVQGKGPICGQGHEGRGSFTGCVFRVTKSSTNVLVTRGVI